MEQLNVFQKLDFKPSNLKDILLHSRNNKNQLFEVLVPKSRFRKILSDYYAINAVNIEGIIDIYVNNYQDYILTELDKNGNAYKIIQNNVQEIKGKCPKCGCKTKRWLNPDTGNCYYHEMIEKDYTTKIYYK